MCKRYYGINCTLLLALLRPTITLAYYSQTYWTCLKKTGPVFLPLRPNTALRPCSSTRFSGSRNSNSPPEPSKSVGPWVPEAIEKRHAQQTRAAHELTTLFASHGVRTIAFERAGPQHLLPPAGAPRMRRHRSVARRLRQGQPFDRRAGD